MKEVFFSIIVPVYNTKRYINDCMKSILHQTYTNFEAIIVDDGSTDGSGLICDEYAEKDNRFKVFHQHNKGSLFTRCIGIKNARGDYCIFLDSDDILKNNALTVLNYEIKKTKCDCIVFGMDRFFGSKIVMPYKSEFIKNTTISDKKDIYLKLFCGEKFNSLCMKAVKKSVFHDYDYEMYFGKIVHGEDRLQTVEIAKNSHSVRFLRDSLYLYRMNPDSTTHADFNASFRQDYTLCKFIYDFLKSENLFSNSDFSHFFGEYIKTMISWIKLIAKSSLKRKERINCIKSYKNDEFYKTIIRSKPNIGLLCFRDKLIYYFFRAGLYDLIVIGYGRKGVIKCFRMKN